MYRTLLGILAVFVVSLFAVGLTFSSALEVPADFTFINASEPKTLDPQKMTGQPEGRVADALFEGLTRLDARTMRPEPGVAERWDVSADGRRYTFHLRRDARWSDGRPVTADDFTFAWRRLQDPATGAEYAYILHGVRFAQALNLYGAQARALRGPVREALAALRAENPGAVAADRWQGFLAETRLADRTKGSEEPALGALLAGRQTVSATDLAAVEAAIEREAARREVLHGEAARRFGVDAGIFAVDAQTLVVELEAAMPYFLDLLSFYSAYPAPRWVIDGEGSEATARESDWFMPGQIVGNGAYRLESWRINDRIRLAKSETYWDRDGVALERIDVLPTENATTSLNLYLTGEVDWLPSNYPSDLVEPLRERGDFYSNPGLSVYYYRINVARPGLDDVRVREAINLAIDRRLITDEVLGLGQMPAHHVVPPGMAGYTAPPSAIRHDPQAARRLLAEAGYPDGQGLPEIGILYNTHDTHKKIAEVIADQLRRELGLRVRAYNQEWQSYLATLRARDYGLARAGWIGDYEDPNTFLDLWVTEGGNNQTNWSDARYDRLVAAAANVEDFADRPTVAIDALAEAASVRADLAGLEAEPDPERRRAIAARLRMRLLAEAERILVNEGFPIIPIYFYVVSGLVRPDIGGFYHDLVLPDGTRGANLRDRHPLRALRRKGEARAEAG